MDEQTKTLGRQLLKLARHDNINGVIVMAQRIETEAPELGIRLESDDGSLYLRFGDDRVQVGRPGPQQRVRYVGEFGSEIGTKEGRPVRVSIEMAAIARIDTYIERLTSKRE